MSRQSVEPTLIARTVTRVVLPIILLTAVALLLQGHNLPGGGFIAGVLTAAGFALVYIIYGQEYLQRTLLGVPAEEIGRGVDGGAVGRYRTTFTFGLALALAAGLTFVLLGGAFLEQVVVFVEHLPFLPDRPLPLYGEVEIASALWFDLGVYFVVVGALLTVLAVVGAE